MLHFDFVKKKVRIRKTVENVIQQREDEEKKYKIEHIIYK